MVGTETHIEIHHRSKYGYHACDHETFLQLKEYHRMLLRAFRQHRRWAAWNRRTVNRTGPEPTQVKSLVELNRCSGAMEFIGYGERPRSRSATLYHHVLAEYRSARHPMNDPESVKPLDLPQGWTTQLKELQDHYGAE